VEEKVVAARSLEPLEAPASDAIPASYAAVGRGEAEDGSPLIVSFAPEYAGDAVLAGLVAATLAGGEGESAFAGEVVAVAPQWTATARRRLSLVGELPFRFRALAASSLGNGVADVEAEPAVESSVLPVDRVAGHLSDATDRALFVRAAAALEGLASKHGGAVRGFGRSLELVVLARRVAELRADDNGVMLNTILPQKSSVRLSGNELAATFDGLEGNLRRRLNDRRARDGEEGMRARTIPLLATGQGLRALLPWPLGGSDQDALDLVGVDPEGRPVVGAIRQALTLPALGAILDATQQLRPSLPTLLSGAELPVRLDASRLALAAQDFAEGVATILPLLAIGHDLYQIRTGRDRGYELLPVSSGEVVASAPSRSSSVASTRAERSQEADERPSERSGADSRGRPRRRGRRRGGRGGGADAADGGADAEGAADASGDGGSSEPEEAEASSGDSSRRRPARFEEVSLFELDEGARNEDTEDSSGSRRRRGRSRRRGRRSGVGGESSPEGVSAKSDDSGDGEPGARSSRRRRGGRSRPEPESEPEPGSESDDLIDDDEALTPAASLASLPEDDSTFAAAPPPYDDEAGDVDAPEGGEEGVRGEARARSASAAATLPEDAAEPAKVPRRRCVIVAHADRDSILSAVLLARDLRLLEGIWIYPQSELMTFFRSVATDLRDETPIYVVGFTASPARDVLQAVSLYSNRLVWFDHQDWPPEDLGGLRQAVSDEAVHVSPGVGSSLPAVLSMCTRRSRFSDKLVDLMTGRFTQHDYERWGRLWWWRVGELASKTGECRADLEPLLAGRPSDLAKEAAKNELPPLPAELTFISARDFRIVHFGGHTLAVVGIEEGLDLHLSARIARERYQASLSLVFVQGSETVFVSGEDQNGRRSVDYAALVEHLADKHEWVEQLSNDDNVARFRIRGLASKPERLDEVVAQIAMGRSLLER